MQPFKHYRVLKILLAILPMFKKLINSYNSFFLGKQLFSLHYISRSMLICSYQRNHLFFQNINCFNSELKKKKRWNLHTLPHSSFINLYSHQQCKSFLSSTLPLAFTVVDFLMRAILSGMRRLGWTSVKQLAGENRELNLYSPGSSAWCSVVT